MSPDELLDPAVLVPIAGGLVVLLGIGIAVVKIALGKAAGRALELWAHAACSIWTGGEDSGTWAQDRAQSALASWYGANGPGPFWDVIEGLRRGTTGNVAWDRVRALDLLRIAFAARYIEADQCWTEAGKIAVELQSQHRSWEALAQAFEAGMHAWQRARGVTSLQETGRVQRNLPALRQQIWPKIAFDARLVAED
jgi:hypothetical protein